MGRKERLLIEVDEILRSIHAERPRPSFEEACAEIRYDVTDPETGEPIGIDNGESDNIIDGVMENLAEWDEDWPCDNSYAEDDDEDEGDETTNLSDASAIGTTVSRQSPPTTDGRPGAMVSVCGLAKRPDLNGRTGQVLRWSADRGRWGVRLVDGESVWLRPENIKLFAPDTLLVNPFAALALGPEPAGMHPFEECHCRDDSLDCDKYSSTLNDKWKRDMAASVSAEPWWYQLPLPSPAPEGSAPTLHAVLRLVAEVRGISATSVLRWRVSRALAHEAHQALADVQELHLGEISPTSIRLLGYHCTGLRSLRLSARLLSDYSHDDLHAPFYGTRSLITDLREEWLLIHADEALRVLLERARPTRLECSNLTWQDVDDGRGHFCAERGNWYRRTDLEDDSDEEGPPLLKRGLNNRGIELASGLLELCLRNCQLVTDTAVAALCKRSPQLRTLNIAHCTGITYPCRALLAVGKSCPELRVLDVSRQRPNGVDTNADYGPMVSDKALQAVADGCRHLERLLVRGQPSTRGAAICLTLETVRALESMSALQHLDVRGANVSVRHDGQPPRLATGVKSTQMQLHEILELSSPAAFAADCYMPKVRARKAAGVLSLRSRSDDHDDE